ncbi:hypothetical protein CB1_000478012 [Camelus ferus]|nr:hypothetical protein CB1_000478012 [Camelus ferus]
MDPVLAQTLPCGLWYEKDKLPFLVSCEVRQSCWEEEMGNRRQPFLKVQRGNYSKMSRNGKEGLEAQGHLHLTVLTGSQLVTVPWSSHAERKAPQSAGAGGITGCSAPGKDAVRMVDLQNRKSAVRVSATELCK